MPYSRPSFFIGYFNPRPREEGDHLICAGYFGLSYFNPRPREEGDEEARALKISKINFNPRPREEGDDISVMVHTRVRISIHALVKRATITLNGLDLYDVISIHALVKRATNHHIFIV